MTLPNHPQDILRAGLYMVVASACFVTNDSFIKALAGELPGGQIVAIRGALATILIAIICWHQNTLGSLPAMFSHHVLVRTMLDLIGTLLFITALMHMPIANLTSIVQAVPLVVLALAAIWLKERVGWRRSMAVLLGLVGVILIVRPTPGTFTIYEAFALSIVLALAVRDILTRRIPRQIPSLIIALANAFFVTIGGLGLALFEGWKEPLPWHYLYIAASAFFLAIGYMCMVTTLRLADLSATAPFRYSIVLFSLISGVVVFGEIPDPIAICGMALIVASGIYAIHRETRLRNIARTQSP
jgi:drug/metabolite transporter (DMT)-like permease